MKLYRGIGTQLLIRMNHPLHQFRYCPRCGSNQFLIHDVKSKKCADCSFIYYANVSTAVAAVIRNTEGDLLVATRANDPAKGMFDLPGGFVDMDETVEEALIREVKEETGLVVEKVKYLFSCPNKYIYSSMIIHTMDLFFECQIAPYSAFYASDDVAELQYIPFEKLKSEEFGLYSIQQAIKKLTKLLA